MTPTMIPNMNQGISLRHLQMHSRHPLAPISLIHRLKTLRRHFLNTPRMPTFANWPTQPIFKHNADTSTPLLTQFLATSFFDTFCLSVRFELHSLREVAVVLLGPPPWWILSFWEQDGGLHAVSSSSCSLGHTLL
jgi:hypothetical protein